MNAAKKRQPSLRHRLAFFGMTEKRILCWKKYTSRL